MPEERPCATTREAWAELDRTVAGWWEDDLRTAREADIRADADGTLLFLPFPYNTAGGGEAAFPEMYGWDTYFINLGMLAHGRSDLVKNHILNQLFMIERYGMVLNGNRTYYLTRSQTPLLADSIRSYHRHVADPDLLLLAYPLLKHEYEGYWNAAHHQTPTGLATNRDLGDPAYRPEIASEAESVDFTPCFGGDVRQCVPLLTNCALVSYERTLAWLATEIGRPNEAERWRTAARSRAQRIRDLCWDKHHGFFFEYNYVRGEVLPVWSLCAYWTLWAGVATTDQAERLVANLGRFEQPYGLPFTDRVYPSPHPEFTNLQWQYPAGWPPMQIIVVEGLAAYGYAEEARRIARRFLRLILEQYGRTGKLWEKYNVVDGSLKMPVERYETPPMRGWSSAAVAVLGRRVFQDEPAGTSSSPALDQSV